MAIIKKLVAYVKYIGRRHARARRGARGVRSWRSADFSGSGII